MLECLIIGDSIAVGIAQHRPDCVVYAREGITSRGWNSRYLQLGKDSKHTIISLGSNDSSFYWVSGELETTRKNLTGRVTWILPANSESIQQTVFQLAKKYNDTVLPIRETIRDGVHPTAREYRNLAQTAK